ncbi:MAG TPA: (Fe-S)-binding protein [Candidatus Mailhella merdavium]|nr:(Fe-S)-binding protein [Candidatus Mailhella merdavium]
MSDLQSLARRLMALDDRIVACMKCGFCQQVCPMFGATMMEADVARGKLALVSNLAHEMIRDPQAVADKLGRCLLCGSCEAACPSGVKIMEVFLTARELVNEYIGLSPVKKAIFRGLLTHPELFNFAMRVGSPVQSVLFKKNRDAQHTVCAPMLNFMLGDRHIRKLAAKPLHSRYGHLDEPRMAGGLKVAFYPGCMGDKMYVDMAEACLKVLRHHNVAVFMPKGLTCCGIPALSSGDAKGMIEQMQLNLNLLEQGNFDYLVTPCGSCTATIKDFWPMYAERLDAGMKKLADDLAAKTMDINQFVVEVLKVQAVPAGDGATVVTYHDPCHLKKALGISAQPRTVIAANPAYELKEMHEADRCCGCGGSFNLFHYDYSRKIGQRKRDNVVASGAKVVATGCPACMMQLEDVLSHNHDDIVVRHPIELYAETLK